MFIYIFDTPYCMEYLLSCIYLIEYIQANSICIHYKNALFLLLLNKTTVILPSFTLQFPCLSFSRLTPFSVPSLPYKCDRSPAGLSTAAHH